MGHRLSARLDYEDKSRRGADASPARCRTLYLRLCQRRCPLRRNPLRPCRAGAHQQAGPRRRPQNPRLTMRTNWLKRAGWITGAMLVLGGLIWFAWPRPIAVDLATVAKGRMEVTIDDEGKTRVRHIYTVSAPIAGKVMRISHPVGNHGVSRHVGDLVTADETVVAVMQPRTPGFIDARSREELEAAVASADAAVKQAEADGRRLQATLDFSRTELQR